MNNELVTNIYTVAATAVPRIEGRLQKLTQRALKKGYKGLAWSFGAPKLRSFEGAEGRGTLMRVVDLSLTRPKLLGYEGWNLVAKVDLLTGENKNDRQVVLTQPYGDETEIPKTIRARAEKFDCEHCGVARARANVYICKNKDAWKVVGSSCMADFLGQAAMCRSDFFEIDMALSALVEEYEKMDNAPMGGAMFGRQALLPLLAATVRMIRVAGWTSSTIAYERGGISTAKAVRSYMDQWHRHEQQAVLMAGAATTVVKDHSDTLWQLKLARRAADAEGREADSAILDQAIEAIYKLQDAQNA